MADRKNALPSEGRDEEQAEVSYFIHEGITTRMQMAIDTCNKANRRMLIAVLTVCVSMLLIISLVVFGFNCNNRNWMKYIQETYTVQEGAVEHADSPTLYK